MAVDACGHEYNEDELGTQEQDIVQERPVSTLPRAGFGHSYPLGLRLQFDVSASADVRFQRVMNTSTTSAAAERSGSD